MTRGLSSCETTSKASIVEEISLHITIIDPSKSKVKGRPREASKIPTVMQATQSQAKRQHRTCSTCNEKGHDIKTCTKDKKDK